MAAPASPHAIAAAAISSSVVGTLGFCFLVGHDPVVAAEMISAFAGIAGGAEENATDSDMAGSDLAASIGSC
jgi:hypothetical protein